MRRFKPSQYSEGEQTGIPVDPNAVAGAAGSIANLVGGLINFFGGKKVAQNQALAYQAQTQASLAQSQVEQQKAAQTALLIKGAVGVAAVLGFTVVSVIAVKKIMASDDDQKEK